MPRVPKHIANELIQFVKKVHVKAHFWDPNSRSAFEFARQMSSPNLKKINPSLEVILEKVEVLAPPTLHVEFLDGNKWDKPTTGLHATELRSLLYESAADAEDKVGDKVGGDAGMLGSEVLKTACLAIPILIIIDFMFPTSYR